MKKELIQRKIDGTEYWDAKVLDFKIDYFGDVVKILFEDEKESIYELLLSQCYKVYYETDAERREIKTVQEMKVLQLAYFIQDISVSDSDMEGFFEIELDLFPLKANVVCKEITISKRKIDELNFFWRAHEKNED
ncbi:hypothetical protein [Listeria booriae]|uniref:hypothetical protein n=1 Tax=Listeria booriae TaxID=1552123 RepID=UPI0016280016|nr:hypothetical protein [Listeria booriae]MBC2149334.1 hypothetical protein [Listeria booriae]